METYDPPHSLASPVDLCAALDAAVTAAHAGAAILQSYAHHRADLVIDRKARNDLVSQADREAEAVIIDELQARTPQFGIVAEETGGQAQGAATWYIDPLDGTTNFLHDIPHYAVSIALIAHAGTAVSPTERLARDTPVAGVIYDPCREELFTAVYGLGAWLNGRRINCSRTRTLDDAVLATGFPFRDFSFAGQYMPMLHDAINRARGVRRVGAWARGRGRIGPGLDRLRPLRRLLGNGACALGRGRGHADRARSRRRLRRHAPAGFLAHRRARRGRQSRHRARPARDDRPAPGPAGLRPGQPIGPRRQAAWSCGAAAWRNSRRKILPTLLLGSSSRNSTKRGRL